MVTINELIEMTLSVLEKLYKNDEILFINDVCERSLVFRFGIYLNNMLNKNDKFNNLNVDSEYNRNVRGVNIYKSIGIDNYRRKTYPDIIIHERGTNDNNQLAIEFKKWNKNKQNEFLAYENKRINIDNAKLEYYTANNKEYKYKLGLAIVFGRVIEDTTITVYLNGKVYNKYGYNYLKRIYQTIKII